MDYVTARQVLTTIAGGVYDIDKVELRQVIQLFECAEAQFQLLEAVADAARALVALWGADLPEGQSLTLSAEAATLRDRLGRLERWTRGYLNR